MTEGIGVQVRVSGRVGPRLCDVLSALDVEPVPRHTVLIVDSGDLSGLHTLLIELEARGIEVQQVTR